MKILNLIKKTHNKRKRSILRTRYLRVSTLCGRVKTARCYCFGLSGFETDNEKLSKSVHYGLITSQKYIRSIVVFPCYTYIYDDKKSKKFIVFFRISLV